MKRSLLIFLVLFPILIFAQIEWQEGGIPVGYGENLYWEGNTAVTTLGYTVLAWSDCRSGKREVYAQKVDSSGQKFWGEDGVQISSGFYINIKPIIKASIDGSVIVSWLTYDTNSNGNLLIQKVNDTGENCWDDSGVIIPFNNNYARKDIMPMDDGKVYVSSSDNEIIQTTLLNSDGSINSNWPTPVEITGTMFLFDLVMDGEGGILLSYRDNNSSLKAVRYNQQGVAFWGDEGLIICENGFESNLKVAKDLDDNFIFCYSYLVDDSVYHSYLKKIDGTGNTVWENQLFTNDPFRYLNNLLISSENNVYLGIMNYESPGSNFVVHKYSTDGDPLWDELGVSVSQLYNNYYFSNAGMTVANNNSVFISWENGNGPSERSIMVQHLDNNGELLFGEDGVEVGYTTGSEPNHILTKNEDLFQVIWLDKSNEYDNINLQALDLSGNFLIPETCSPIFQGKSIAVADYSHIQKDNKSIILWSGFGNGGKVAFQIIDEYGNLEQPISGSVITSDGNQYQSNVKAASGINDDIAVVIWREGYGSNNCQDAYAQALDFEGNLLWGAENGISLLDNAFNDYGSVIDLYDNNGIDEYYIAIPILNEIQYDLRVNVQKIIDGEKQWGDSGVTIDGPGNSRPVALTGRYIGWRSWSTGAQ